MEKKVPYISFFGLRNKHGRQYSSNPLVELICTAKRWLSHLSFFPPPAQPSRMAEMPQIQPSRACKCLNVRVWPQLHPENPPDFLIATAGDSEYTLTYVGDKGISIVGRSEARPFFFQPTVSFSFSSDPSTSHNEDEENRPTHPGLLSMHPIYDPHLSTLSDGGISCPAACGIRCGSPGRLVAPLSRLGGTGDPSEQLWVGRSAQRLSRECSTSSRPFPAHRLEQCHQLLCGRICPLWACVTVGVLCRPTQHVLLGASALLCDVDLSSS